MKNVLDIGNEHRSGYGLRHRLPLLWVLALAGANAGCSTQIHPGEVTAIAQPTSVPERTATSYTEALSCMDDMLLRFNYTNATEIVSTGLADATGKMQVSTRDMLIQAVSSMSRRSGAFKYIDTDAAQIEIYGQKVEGNRVLPNRPDLHDALFIRGSISQLDDGVDNKSQNIGAGVKAASVGTNSQDTASFVAVDTSIGEVNTREILPGTSVSNTLVFKRHGEGVDLDAHISSTGFTYSYNVDQQEGGPVAVRTLIELNAIEMVGKFYKLPYWECLGIRSTDPTAVRTLNEYYNNRRPEQRVQLLANRLSALGYYQGEISAAGMTSELRAAAARYQQDHNMPANGLESFELFLALNRYRDWDRPSASSDVAEPIAPKAATPGADGPAIHISWHGNSRPDGAAVFAGEPVLFKVDVSQDTYVTCFYQDGDGVVFRAFPSTAGGSELVRAHAVLTIPGAGDDFRIRPITPNTIEHLACFAATQPILPRLPGNIGGTALTPLDVDRIGGLMKAISHAMGASLLTQYESTYPVGKPRYGVQ